MFKGFCKQNTHHRMKFSKIKHIFCNWEWSSWLLVKDFKFGFSEKLSSILLSGLVQLLIFPHCVFSVIGLAQISVNDSASTCSLTQALLKNSNFLSESIYLLFFQIPNLQPQKAKPVMILPSLPNTVQPILQTHITTRKLSTGLSKGHPKVTFSTPGHKKPP